MNDKANMRWRGIKARGLRHFVLIYGALGWGCCTAATLVVGHRLIFGFWPRDVPSIFAMFSVGGLFWGLAMWFIVDWFHSKATKTEA